MNLYEVSYNAWQGGEDWDVDDMRFEALSAEGAELQFRQWARERKIMYRGEINVAEILNPHPPVIEPTFTLSDMKNAFKAGQWDKTNNYYNGNFDEFFKYYSV